MAKVATGADPLTKAQRSERMGRVRATGNASTEGPVLDWLRDEGIEGWILDATEVLGRPDFYFPDLHLAIFVDGCFWHGCPTCDRNVPRTRTDFWRSKITANGRRDRKVTRELRAQGHHVLRLWEHDLRHHPAWTRRVRRMLTICAADGTIRGGQREPGLANMGPTGS